MTQCCLALMEEEFQKEIERSNLKTFLELRSVTIMIMYDYIKPLLKKCPDNIILHVGTNHAVNESSKVVLGKLLELKKFIENTLPESNFVISNLITRRVKTNEYLKTVVKTNEHLHGLQMDIIDNENITSNELNQGGLHFNPRGLGKLVINLTSKP